MPALYMRSLSHTPTNGFTLQYVIIAQQYLSNTVKKNMKLHAMNFYLPNAGKIFVFLFYFHSSNFGP